MAELRTTAQLFGMNLNGWQIQRDVRAIDRPMLAYIRDDRLRHYLIIRPVGSTGSLVQVIDSDDPPRIMDKADLCASPQWTGLVLAPRRTDWSLRVGTGLLIVAGFLGCARLIRRQRHLSVGPC